MRKFNKDIIFIIGSGRSGTHLISEVISQNDKVEAFIEDERYFMDISCLAAGLIRDKSYQYFIHRYQSIFSNSEKQIILEKTHPNIWFVEELMQGFPNAKFLGIYRNVYATVNSMLLHPGVLKWYEKLNLKKINPFLGITEKNIDIFESSPIETKCAFRCLSHIDRIHYLNNHYPENVIKINYDELYDNFAVTVSYLEERLGLKTNMTEDYLIHHANLKWRDNLSKSQKLNINKAIEQWQSF